MGIGSKRKTIVVSQQIAMFPLNTYFKIRKETQVILFTALILLVSAAHSFAQHKNLKFEHLGTHEGLSHSNTICMLQDRRGFMWFGTRDGLNKYDGYSFTVYRNKTNDKTSLSCNIINDIAEDSNGGLWIATWGGGLSYYN